jgi:hypothetical protein
VLIRPDHTLGDGEADRGFANAAGPDNRDQALVRKLCDKRCHDLLATNHPNCRDRQIVLRHRRGCRGQEGSRRLLFAYRCDEIVAPSNNRGDVAIVALPVAERTTQSADLDFEIRFFHERCWLGSGDQLLLADNLPGAFDQSSQDIKRATAEPHRLVALEQEPLRRKKSEWAECDRGAAAR